jgi:hypothetical protein
VVEIESSRKNQQHMAFRVLIKFAPESEREQVLQEIKKKAKKKGVSLTETVVDLAPPENKVGLTSNQIRHKLEQSGLDLEDYSQPLAVHVGRPIRSAGLQYVFWARTDWPHREDVTFVAFTAQLAKNRDSAH